MVVTVLCAGFTVVFFIISSVNEAQWKFGDEESTVEISSKKHVWYILKSQNWLLFLIVLLLETRLRLDPKPTLPGSSLYREVEKVP